MHIEEDHDPMINTIDRVNDFVDENVMVKIKELK